jgi:AcrR family transcriptional regulator
MAAILADVDRARHGAIGRLLIMATRRARSLEDKMARHGEILDAAREVFDAGEVDEFTMDAVANALQLAKGTLYRYFPTREGLLLALADDEYQQWFSSVDAALASPASGDQVEALAVVLVDELMGRTRFMRLAAMVPSVLEHNIPFETAMLYKCRVMALSRGTAAIIGAWLGIADDDAVRLLIHLQASAIGLYMFANPAPIIRQVLADPSFEGRHSDLRSELLFAARAIIVAATTTSQS